MPAGDTGGAPRSESALVIVGRVRKPQGLHGEVLVQPITDAPDVIFAPGARVHLGTADGDPTTDQSFLTVTRGRPFKDGYIVRFAEADDRDAVETWRGRYLLAPQAGLAPLAGDEIYRHQLLGMRVADDSVGDLGTVTELYDLPQGLTLEVEGPRGSVLIPYRPEIVRRVDPEDRTIRIAAPAGLLD